MADSYFSIPAYIQFFVQAYLSYEVSSLVVAEAARVLHHLGYHPYFTCQHQARAHSWLKVPTLIECLLPIAYYPNIAGTCNQKTTLHAV